MPVGSPARRQRAVEPTLHWTPVNTKQRLCKYPNHKKKASAGIHVLLAIKVNQLT